MPRGKICLDSIGMLQTGIEGMKSQSWGMSDFSKGRKCLPYIKSPSFLAGNYRTATAHIITAVIGSGVLALGYAVGTVRAPPLPPFPDCKYYKGATAAHDLCRPFREARAKLEKDLSHSPVFCRLGRSLGPSSCCSLQL